MRQAAFASAEIQRVLQTICGWTSPAPSQRLLLEDLEKQAKTIAARSDIFTDALATEPHYLLSGWACWRFDLADGRRQIIQLVLPGDRLGGVLALRGALATLTAVKTIPVSAVEAHLAEEGARRDLRVLSAEQTSQCGLVDQIIRLGQLSAYERMAHFILELRGRLLGNGHASDRSFMVPLTQEALADSLGVSVVHTNRVLQRLRRERLIELSGGRLTILDLAGLEIASGLKQSPIINRYIAHPSHATHAPNP